MHKRCLKFQNFPFFRLFRIVCLVTQGNGTNSNWFYGSRMNISRGYISEIGHNLILIWVFLMGAKIPKISFFFKFSAFSGRPVWLSRVLELILCCYGIIRDISRRFTSKIIFFITLSFLFLGLL